MVPSLITWISCRWLHHLSHESHQDGHGQFSRRGGWVDADWRGPPRWTILAPDNQSQSAPRISAWSCGVTVAHDLYANRTTQYSTLITKTLHKLSNWAPFEKDSLWVKTLILKGTFCAGGIAFKPVSESIWQLLYSHYNVFQVHDMC